MAPTAHSRRRIGMFSVLLMTSLQSTATAVSWGTRSPVVGLARSSAQLVAEDVDRPQVRTALSRADEAHIWRQVEHAYHYTDPEDDDMAVASTTNTGNNEQDALGQNDDVRLFGHQRIMATSLERDVDDEWREWNTYSSRIRGRIV